MSRARVLVQWTEVDRHMGFFGGRTVRTHGLSYWVINSHVLVSGEYNSKLSKQEKVLM